MITDYTKMILCDLQTEVLTHFMNLSMSIETNLFKNMISFLGIEGAE